MASTSNTPQSPWKDREVRARFHRSARELGELGAWVRLQYVYPYPHVDEVIGADGGGQDPALSRHSLPACQPRGAEGDAAPGCAGEDAGADRALARACART